MSISGRTPRLARIGAAIVMVVVLAAFGIVHKSTPPPSAYSLPTDPQPTCVVTPTIFASWFQLGTVNVNGVVNPANSITFSNVPNCPFYQWAQQMFLWAASPVPGGGLVLNSPTFFEVSPPNISDADSRTFTHPAAGVIDAEQGMADNSVLEAQLTAGGSLVYYITYVNDVYALYATGVKDNAILLAPNSICPNVSITNQCFPITAGDASQVAAFAASHGVTFQDPNALAVMVKSAWVLAAGLPNLSSYITTKATVPTYDMSDPTHWVANGTQTVQLALVGIHIVGSTAGHPEMIWATFEHFANAPRATYSYINTSGATVTVPQNTNAAWVFTTTNSTGTFNCLHMDLPSFASPNIVANSPASPCAPNTTISPSDTIRWKAFGAASNGAPDPLDSTPASNTEIIALNNAIDGMLSGDIRTNYVLTGATWTIGGAAPTFPSSFQLGGNGVGTSVLADATLETYQQGIDTTVSNDFTPHNCLDCHTSNTFNVSHDFGNLKPISCFTSGGYSLSSSPSNVFMTLASTGNMNLKPQEIVTTTIAVHPCNGFLSPVNLTVTGLPAGVKAVFKPPTTSTKSTLTLTASANATLGQTTLAIIGSSGNLAGSASLSLNVSAPNFGMTASPDAITLDQNGSATDTVTIYPEQGFSGDVTLANTALPAGVTATYNPNPATSSSTLTLTASAQAKTGTETITIGGTSGKLRQTTTFRLTVKGAQ